MLCISIFASHYYSIPFLYWYSDSADIEDSCKRFKIIEAVNQPSQLKENEMEPMNSVINIKPDPDYDQNDLHCAPSDDKALCDSNLVVTLNTEDVKVKSEIPDVKNESPSSEGNSVTIIVFFYYL